MKIVIPEIPVEGFDLKIEETIELDNLISPVMAQLRIQKIGLEVMVRGNLTADLQLQCSRCLKDFKRHISVPVDVVYHPVTELKGEEKYELNSEELDMGFYSGEELELLDLIKEQIMLNLPMKPLCSDSCKGICPQCGTDLNAGNCGCSTEDIDPRLEVLKRLLDT
ncbi:MAG: YceD family protein [Nitrospirota bacterium]